MKRKGKYKIEDWIEYYKIWVTRYDKRKKYYFWFNLHYILADYYPQYIAWSLSQFLRYIFDGWYMHEFLGIKIVKKAKPCKYCGKPTQIRVVFAKSFGDLFEKPKGINDEPICHKCLHKKLKEHLDKIYKAFLEIDCSNPLEDYRSIKLILKELKGDNYEG